MINQSSIEPGSKCLTMQSHLGWFLINPKAPEILANHKDFKGQSALVTDIDYTKCMNVGCDRPRYATHEYCGRSCGVGG